MRWEKDLGGRPRGKFWARDLARLGKGKNGGRKELRELNLFFCYFDVQGAKWMKCRALFALDKNGGGMARGGDIAVRVGLTEKVSTRERRDR